MRTYALRGAAAMVALGLTLSGCGGGDSDDDAADSKPTAAATTTDDGLTVPGTTLTLGQKATVAFAPDAKHQSRLAIAVTSVKRGSTKDLTQFDLPDRAKEASVYYVHVKVQNAGQGDVAGTSLVLYGQVSDTLVVPPVTFGSTFDKCDYQPFGKKFTTGAKTDVCIVLMAPDKGKVTAIQWRGPQDEKPISWPAS